MTSYQMTIAIVFDRHPCKGAHAASSFVSLTQTTVTWSECIDIYNLMAPLVRDTDSILNI